MRALQKIAVECLKFLGVVVVLLVLLYLGEDWRGAWDWARCQKDLAARGESLDLRTLVPPGDPKDDLSKVPIFAEVYAWAQEDSHASSSSQAAPKTRLFRVNLDLGSSNYGQMPHGDFRRKEETDLLAWQKFYRALPESRLPKESGTPAQDVLKALAQLDPEMTEVEQAMANPQAFWPIDYDRPFETSIAAIARMLEVERILSLRGTAELADGKSEQAKRDYQMSIQLNRPLWRSDSLIEYLISIADLAIAYTPLWEGIHRHAWTEGQLEDLGAKLGSFEMLAMAQKTFRTERNFGLQNMTMMQNWVAKANVGSGWSGLDLAATLLRLRPAGWWDQDRICYSLRMQRHIDGIDPARGVLAKMPDVAPASVLRSIYTPISNVAGPTLGAESKIAEAETLRREARMACRLEEFYLAHKAYPESLAELGALPAHLNQEVMSKNPLHYRRVGDSYVLYSPGWDGKDRGGTPRAQGQSGDDFDWVWPGP